MMDTPRGVQQKQEAASRNAAGKTELQEHYGKSRTKTSRNVEGREAGNQGIARGAELLASRDVAKEMDGRQATVQHVTNSLRIGDSADVRRRTAPATRYPTNSGTRLLGPSRTTLTPRRPVRRYA